MDTTHKGNLIAWANGVLQKRGLTMDSEEDLKDGVLFHHLVELLSGKPMPKSVTTATSQVQSLINLFYVLSFLADQGLQLSQDTCCAQEIARGNSKHAVYLLERMASHYVKEDSAEGTPAVDDRNVTGIDDFNIEYRPHPALSSSNQSAGIRRAERRGPSFSPRSNTSNNNNNNNNIYVPYDSNSNGSHAPPHSVSAIMRRRTALGTKNEKRLSMPAFSFALLQNEMSAMMSNPSSDAARPSTSANNRREQNDPTPSPVKAVEAHGAAEGQQGEVSPPVVQREGIREDGGNEEADGEAPPPAENPVTDWVDSNRHLPKAQAVSVATLESLLLPSSAESQAEAGGGDLPPSSSSASVSTPIEPSEEDGKRTGLSPDQGTGTPATVDSDGTNARPTEQVSIQTGDETTSQRKEEDEANAQEPDRLHKEGQDGMIPPEGGTSAGLGLPAVVKKEPEDSRKQDGTTPRVAKKPKNKRPKSKSKGEDIATTSSTKEASEDTQSQGNPEPTQSPPHENQAKMQKKDRKDKKKGKEKEKAKGKQKEKEEENEKEADEAKEVNTGNEERSSRPDSEESPPMQKRRHSGLVGSDSEDDDETSNDEVMDMWSFLKSTPPPPKKTTTTTTTTTTTATTTTAGNLGTPPPPSGKKLISGTVRPKRSALLPLLKKLSRSPAGKEPKRRRGNSSGSIPSYKNPSSSSSSSSSTSPSVASSSGGKKKKKDKKSLSNDVNAKESQGEEGATEETMQAYAAFQASRNATASDLLLVEEERNTRAGRAHTAAGRLTRHSSPSLAFPDIDSVSRERSASCKEPKDIKVVSDGDLAGSKVMALQPPPPLGYSSLSAIRILPESEGPLLLDEDDVPTQLDMMMMGGDPGEDTHSDLSLFEFVQLLEKEHGFIPTQGEVNKEAEEKGGSKSKAEEQDASVQKEEEADKRKKKSKRKSKRRDKRKGDKTDVHTQPEQQQQQQLQLQHSEGNDNNNNNHPNGVSVAGGRRMSVGRGSLSPRKHMIAPVEWVSAQEGSLYLFTTTSGWISRYFILKGDVLRYYESSPILNKGVPCLGSILLFNAVLEVSKSLDDQYGRENCMGILKEGSDEEDKILLSAPSSTEFERWVRMLTSCNIFFCTDSPTLAPSTAAQDSTHTTTTSSTSSPPTNN